MRVDFYQLSRDPAEKVVPLIARKVIGDGERLLVVVGDAGKRKAVAKALWEQDGAFLANGEASRDHADRQPILLSESCDPGNGARLVAIADGAWRDEADDFERVFLLFGEAELDGARACWRMLGERDSVERHFWKQDGGKWVEGP